jgi:hypothetical protein
MKNTLMRSSWLILLLAMTVSRVLAQEGEVAEAASNDSGPGLMIGILVLGASVIVGLGLAMNSQQSTENDSE